MVNNNLEQIGFVDISNIDSSIKISLMYSTPNNFIGKAVYPENANAYLHQEVASALANANQDFKQKGYCLRVWDAYRPFSIQEQLFKIYPDPNYVFKPVRNGSELIDGSRHSRGTAVDVTLCDLETSENIIMPTDFDDFTEKAHRDYLNCNQQAIQNRELLEQVMSKYGFIGWPYEWWHFDWHDYKKFSLQDIPMITEKKETL